MTRCGVPVKLEYSLSARSSRHWRPRAENGEAVSLDVDVPGREAKLAARLFEALDPCASLKPLCMSMWLCCGGASRRVGSSPIRYRFSSDSAMEL